jgi:hypothetical protein
MKSKMSPTQSNGRLITSCKTGLKQLFLTELVRLDSSQPVVPVEEGEEVAEGG